MGAAGVGLEWLAGDPHTCAGPCCTTPAARAFARPQSQRPLTHKSRTCGYTVPEETHSTAQNAAASTCTHRRATKRARTPAPQRAYSIKSPRRVATRTFKPPAAESPARRMAAAARPARRGDAALLVALGALLLLACAAPAAHAYPSLVSVAGRARTPLLSISRARAILVATNFGHRHHPRARSHTCRRRRSRSSSHPHSQPPPHQTVGGPVRVRRRVHHAPVARALPRHPRHAG